MTTAPRLVAPGKVSTRFRRTSRGARIARLRVSGLDPKGGAALRCQGAHCPFRIRSIKGSSVADFTRRLARVRLRVGTQLRLELVAPGRAHRLLAWVVTRDGVQRIRR